MSDCIVCSGGENHLGLCMVELQTETSDFREGFFAAVIEREKENEGVLAAMERDFPTPGYRDGFRTAYEFLSCSSFVELNEHDAKDKSWLLITAEADGNATYCINKGKMEFQSVGFKM
jgi:hypothetical protein